MRLIADVHGATAALSRVAQAGNDALLILGDLINFVDYRNNDGILSDVAGREVTGRLVDLRTRGEFLAARELWDSTQEGRESEFRRLHRQAVLDAYDDVMAPLDGIDCLVTFGNVDRPDDLRAALPATARFVDGEVLDVEGFSVGIAGGGITSIGTSGEVSEEVMAAKLESIGRVDILCTHVPPAIDPLQRDVVGGQAKGSHAVLAYLRKYQPRWHYFGDVHQPQAFTWRVGPTSCRNLGYFRATGRSWTHSPARFKGI